VLENRGVILFVSHRWLRPSEGRPDDEHAHRPACARKSAGELRGCQRLARGAASVALAGAPALTSRCSVLGTWPRTTRQT
jgi:hypothetical protein